MDQSRSAEFPVVMVKTTWNLMEADAHTEYIPNVMMVTFMVCAFSLFKKKILRIGRDQMET